MRAIEVRRPFVTRPTKAPIVAYLLAASLALLLAMPLTAQPTEEVVRVSRLLDGRGGVLLERDLVIGDGVIVEILPLGSGVGERVHDLTGFTVLPGLIDTHVHVGWHFDAEGRLARGSEMPDRCVLPCRRRSRPSGRPSTSRG